MKPNSKFLLFFIFFPPVSLLFLMYKYAVNIAHWDDHAIRYSVINIVKSNSFLEKIQLLFKQHNEHRIVITRITAYISNLFVGSIDYRFLMLVGFAFLISILLIISRLNFNKLILSIFSLLIFHPAFNENTFWGMAAVQNFGVLFFAFLTAYFVAKENIIMAILAATLCVFTSGNGILILIAV